MNRKRFLPLFFLTAFLALSFTSLCAQTAPARPFRNGSVWAINMIRMKPGMESAYLNYLAGDWKREQEAAKAAGLIVSYRVLTTEGHDTKDWNLLLMTEFKDLATLEANEKKADALAQKVIGNDEKQMQGYTDRSNIREVVGDRLAREIVLEPRP